MTPTPFPPKRETLADFADQLDEHLRYLDHSGPTLALTETIDLLRDDRLAAALDIYRGDVAFHWVVDWLTRWLDRHYPEGTIVCSGAPDADSGAQFTHAIREALAQLRQRLEGGKNG